MYWGAGKECRYSRARRGIDSIRDIWGLLGVFGVLEAFGENHGASGDVGVSGMYWGAGRECRYSRTRRGIGGIRGHLGLLGGLWHWGHQGV